MLVAGIEEKESCSGPYKRRDVKGSCKEGVLLEVMEEATTSQSLREGYVIVGHQDETVNFMLL